MEEISIFDIYINAYFSLKKIFKNIHEFLYKTYYLYVVY